MKMQKNCCIPLLLLVVFFLMLHPAEAKQFEVGGQPLNLFGYVTQSVQFSLYDDDRYDTEQDINSALFNLFIEGDYSFSNDLVFYASSMVTVDWIYDIKHDDKSWDDKLFSESRRNMYFDDEYWQILKELHFTWTPGDFYFRAGKQIVAWGETLGVRIMDQINPFDQRRGFADVEFETTIIPIWLLRTEYYPPNKPAWLQDLAIEFIFNPNADFIPDNLIRSGNDAGGIWAPGIEIPIPFAPARIASTVTQLEEPDDWNSDGYEYAVRLKGLIKDAFVTLNYFYGYDNLPLIVTNRLGAFPIDTGSDGSWLWHPQQTGKYRLLRYVGVTFARDFQSLNLKALGGVAPTFRLEAFYAFDTEFATALETYNKSDEIRWALTIDWKVKLNWLNPRNYIIVSPQFYHRHVLAYPDRYRSPQGTKGYKEGPDQFVEDDTYIGVIMIMSQYLHGKILPSFFTMRDFVNKAGFYRMQVTYARDHNWNFSVGAVLLYGTEMGGFNVFENKDYMFFKVSYRWG